MPNPSSVAKCETGFASIEEIDGHIQDLFSQFKVDIESFNQGVQNAFDGKPFEEAQQPLAKSSIESSRCSNAASKPSHQEHSSSLAKSRTPTFADVVKKRLAGKALRGRLIRSAARNKTKKVKVRTLSSISITEIVVFGDMMKQHAVASLDANYQPVLGLILHL